MGEHEKNEKTKKAANTDNSDRDEPVSLSPLDPETALRALLAVDPESEPADAESDKEKSRKSDG